MFQVQALGPADAGTPARDKVAAKAAGRAPDYAGTLLRKDGTKVRYLVWHEPQFWESVRMRWRVELVPGLGPVTMREVLTPVKEGT